MLTKLQFDEAFEKSINRRWPGINLSAGMMEDWYEALKTRSVWDIEKAAKYHGRIKKLPPVIQDIMDGLPKDVQEGVTRSNLAEPKVWYFNTRNGHISPVRLAPAHVDYPADVLIKAANQCVKDWGIGHETIIVEGNSPDLVGMRQELNSRRFSERPSPAPPVVTPPGPMLDPQNIVEDEYDEYMRTH
jgi:hypothetical protein